jgi:hypothetical protein
MPQNLSPEEQTIFNVALATYQRVIVALGLSAACYRMSFFLAALLDDEHQIKVKPFIGYVNDGTDDIMSSHAWVTYDNKLTDITLIRPEHPEITPPGALVILGRTLIAGQVQYSYHREITAAATKANEQVALLPGGRARLREQQANHLAMSLVAKEPQRIRAYLDGAPDGFDYARLAEIVRS